ncbi:putative bifunctional diguanylate cyclase/phosphodiesterase [Sphingomonas radiodurans]|uniref:putative bifunctional diguanylate cyclase/phosphodiesterase n=1 Tax=Sphingomonas radiodurans TaxID=2890321 RepID=UPI001E508570|nr:bifunctional diguanylate cyclase/phosphodiesterase [Sphingomonas radiodurans]WBH18177.1 bifunctional diguanylate cyclase/phosphodiesterase [Sphingomonas radiodurans]
MPPHASLVSHVQRDRAALVVGVVAAAFATVQTAGQAGVIERWRQALASGGWHLDELLLLFLVPLLALLTISGRAVGQLRRDIAGRDRESARTRDLALRDPLTGLFNRRGLDDALATQCSGNRLVFVADLDTFKAFNDTHGHAVGDVLLQRLADRLRSMQTAFGGVAARLGGDEFVFVAPPIPDEQVIRERLSAPLFLECIGAVDVSVGAARCDDIDSVEQALESADLAMYKAKRDRALTRASLDHPAERAFERDPAHDPLVAATYAVVAIGVEQFRSVKHALGYGHAGKLARAMRERVQAHFPNLAVERLSSDVLGVLVPVEAVEETIAALQMLSGSYLLEGVAVESGMAFGHAVPRGDAGLRDTVEQAQFALDEARRLGRVSVNFDYNAQLRQRDNVELMNDLQNAITMNALQLYYQPKVDARTNLIDSFEALVRWPCVKRGMISPADFIPVAEESGDIRALTLWVLERACADRVILDKLKIMQPLYINISARLVSDDAFTKRLIAALLSTNGRIGIEVTETAVLENPACALDNLSLIATAGVPIAIDDYGAGLSSLTYLKQMPANELKIDMSFIRDLADSHRGPLIVRSTIDLAHSLGLRVTAEGVDKPEIMALLKVMGCDIIQGHQIARPMTLEALLGFVDTYVPEDLAAAPMAARLLGYAES